MGHGILGRTATLLFADGQRSAAKVVGVSAAGWILEGDDSLAGLHGAAYALVNEAGLLEAWACIVDGGDVRRVDVRLSGDRVTVLNGRRERSHVPGLTVKSEDGTTLTVTDVSERGFGFVCAGLPHIGVLSAFTASLDGVTVRLTGYQSHIVEILPGLYRGGVSLRLRNAQEHREWTGFLAHSHSRTAA
ncbi:MAG: hypothetical protein JST30_05380 [Armatimonadetes bacterium]|nr:hypothetical protein [Armatimonadota bacterium]